MIDHVAAIKQEADRLYHMALIQEPDRDQLYRHADALGAQVSDMRRWLMYHDQLEEFNGVANDPRLRRSIIESVDDRR